MAKLIRFILNRVNTFFLTMKPICQYNLRGKCRFGDKCHNSHSSPPPTEECLKCRTKAFLNPRKLCEKCNRKTCVLCLSERPNDRITCTPCQQKVCTHCKKNRKLHESQYCSECSLFCKGCNPATPSYFHGPLCKNCQEWCPRCIEMGKGKVPKYPGEQHCESCLRDLCCGCYSRNSRSKVFCLKCRYPKKCSIPCCTNATQGERSAPCSRCAKTAYDLFYGYGPHPFNTKLKPEEISSKYSVRVRYWQLIEEHDGYCSDHYNDTEESQTMDVWLPLPSMLDQVADPLMAAYQPEEEKEKSEESDDDDFWTDYGRKQSSMECSFQTEIVDGSDDKKSGPCLPGEYHFFYQVTEGCHHGSGYCGRGTKYTPVFVELLRL